MVEPTHVVKIGSRACGLLIAALLVAGGTALHADQTVRTGAIHEAEQLRNAGRLTEAARVLREQLARHPDDGDAARLLAQTLYWLHENAAARRLYTDSLARHPQDTTLRLQFARMLAETRDYAAARDVLAPLADRPATRVEAAALLGTIAYWEGDVTTARRLFRRVLDQQPAHAESRRQLAEIDAASAPWLRFSAGLRHDDQPLDRATAGVEAGWFATPLVTLTARSEPLRFRTGDETVTRLWSNEGTVSAYVPQSHLELEGGGGFLGRPRQADADGWFGHAGLGIRVTPAVALRGRIERRPYLSTTASIGTPVNVRAARVLLAWNDPRGWLAEAGVERQAYPDDNAVTSAYAWLLAPLVHRPGGDLQIGYAWGRADAGESRFVLASPVQPVPPSNPRFDFSGRYLPYFTPDDQVTHAIPIAAAVHGRRGLSLRLGGSVPVRATEQAPVFTLVNGVLARTTFERTYSPWTARGSLQVPLGTSLALGVSGEVGRTAFYEWAGGDVQLTVKLRKVRD